MKTILLILSMLCSVATAQVPMGEAHGDPSLELRADVPSQDLTIVYRLPLSTAFPSETRIGTKKYLIASVTPKLVDGGYRVIVQTATFAVTLNLHLDEKYKPNRYQHSPVLFSKDVAVMRYNIVSVVLK